MGIKPTHSNSSVMVGRKPGYTSASSWPITVVKLTYGTSLGDNAATYGTWLDAQATRPYSSITNCSTCIATKSQDFFLGKISGLEWGLNPHIHIYLVCKVVGRKGIEFMTSASSWCPLITYGTPLGDCASTYGTQLAIRPNSSRNINCSKHCIQIPRFFS